MSHHIGPRTISALGGSIKRKALTASEVAQNYNAIRSRYGL